MAEKSLELLEDEDNSEDDVFCDDISIKSSELDTPDQIASSWLQAAECPFTWLPSRFSDISSREMSSKIEERIRTDDKFDSIFPFEKFVKYLILVYEYSHQREQEKSLDKLEICERLFEEEESKDVETYNQLKEALSFVLQATRVHLLYRCGKITQAKQIADSLPASDSMSREAQTVVAGMKARFFHQYREDGVRLALQFAREALSLAPNQPLWQVLTAQCLRRLRKFHFSTGQVSSEEISLLEATVKLQRNARHLLLLAEAYREQADLIFKAHRGQTDFFQSQTFIDISNMQAKAFELYKEALFLKPNEEMVNRLCGFGLLKLPAFKSDYQLAHQCLQKALELAPGNAITIHAIGLYYYKGLMEYDRAALFCEKAGKLGNFPASLDMLRMKHLVYGNNYDPVFDFGKLLQQYGEEQTKRHEVLCQMGSYYMFFERNLPKALKYFRILMKESSEHSIMTSHKCTFLNMACKINLFECVINEGTRLLQESKEHIDEKTDKSDLEDVNSFLEELKTTKPELFSNPTNANLIDELHKVSDDIKQTYMRKKERRESVKEKWRHSASRKASMEESWDPQRRHHSESGVNSRFKNTGSVSDWSKHKNSNSPKHTTRHSVGSFSSTSDFINISHEKNAEGRKRIFYRSTSVKNSSSTSNSRQRGSVDSYDTLRSTNFIGFKRQMSEGAPPKIPELELVQSSDRSSNNPSVNSNPKYKREVSWNGQIVTEIPNDKNWRRKCNKIKNSAPD